MQKITGNMLKFARLLSGKSTKEVSEHLGMKSTTVVSYLENDKKNIEEHKELFDIIGQEIFLSQKIYERYCTKQIPDIRIDDISLTGKIIQLSRTLRGLYSRELSNILEIKNKAIISTMENAKSEDEMIKKHIPGIKRVLKNEIKLVYELLQEYDGPD